MRIRRLPTAFFAAAMTFWMIDTSLLADDAHHPPEAGSQAAPTPAPQGSQGMPGRQGMMGGQGMPGPGMMGGGQGMVGGGMMDMMRMMMGQRGMMGDMPMLGMTDHVEGHIAFLRAELKITDQQTRPWNEFANALRENAKKISSVRMSVQGQQTLPTFAQALELQEQLLRARVDGLATIRIAYDHMQSVLSGDQKKLAEQLLPPQLGLMPMGMM